MSKALLKALHKAAALGWVYNSIQFIAGDWIIQPKLRRRLAGRRGRVLDIGGGTGAVGRLLPAECLYICLDNEMPKLQQLASKALGSPLLADATGIPIQTGSIDTVTCALVTHHLAEEQLEGMLRESSRVLKDGGSFVFMDAVMKPSRLPGLLLWKLDRGSNPRRAGELRQALERHFSVVEWNRLAVYHEYVIGVFRKDAGARTSTPSSR